MVVTIARVLRRHKTFHIQVLPVAVLSRFMVRGSFIVTHILLVELRFPPVAVVVVDVVAVTTMTQTPVVQTNLAADFATRGALAKSVTVAPVEFLAV